MIAIAPVRTKYAVGRVNGRVPESTSFKSFVACFRREHTPPARGNFIKLFFTAVICCAVLVLTAFAYNEDYSVSFCTLTDELCSEWNGDGDNKGPIHRMDEPVIPGVQLQKNQTSVFLPLYSFYLPFQTYLFFSLPAGRSPPC